MKQEDSIVNILLIILAVCCLCSICRLAESRDTYNMPSTPEIQTTEALNSVDENNSFYIVNSNTKKIHRMNCAEIEKMKSDHITIAADKKSLEEQGYKGCKKCNP